MKILHCNLSNFYIDGFNYQENILPKIHFKNGHDVKIVASTETYIDGKLDYVKPSKYFTDEGIEVIRLPYRKYLPHFLMKKIRHYKGLKEILHDFRPDVIMFHGAQAFELFTVCKYKKNNPHVKLYVDNHSYDDNSGKNFFSKYILHRIFYKNILKMNLKYIDKILCVTLEAKDFLLKNYKIPEDKLEFYPLGGIVIDEKTKYQYRKEIRKELNLSDEHIVMCHSGKLNKKKRTYELIKNFSRVKDERFRLIIIGIFHEDVKEKVYPLIEKDSRIIYLGWKKSEDLIKYIAASDLYVQPGTQSVTMQNALCAGTPVLFYNYKSHRIFMKGNAFMINDYDDMEKIFRIISKNPDILKDMSKKAYKIAKEMLDYEKLARRILK
ncbi:MAG: 1,2-diacylglycerol 3-alpha-glucosyltransferase [Geotoga sp.]|nr:1,2-diacylglycerol 3-alpha-glucosyltransferase [Geotoga sp.]